MQASCSQIDLDGCCKKRKAEQSSREVKPEWPSGLTLSSQAEYLSSSPGTSEFLRNYITNVGTTSFTASWGNVDLSCESIRFKFNFIHIQEHCLPNQFLYVFLQQVLYFYFISRTSYFSSRFIIPAYINPTGGHRPLLINIHKAANSSRLNNHNVQQRTSLDLLQLTVWFQSNLSDVSTINLLMRRTSREQ